MKITKPAILGRSIKVSNMRTRDEEGDEGGDAGELAPGREVLLTEMVIPRKFAEKLLGTDLLFAALFDTSKKPIEPLSEVKVSSLKIDSKFKGCSALITFGVSKKSIEMDNARIKNISLKPVTGGCFEMRCVVQGIMPRHVMVLDLEDFIGKEINASLSFGTEEEADDDEDKQQDFVAEQQREAAGDGEESEESPASKQPNGGNRRTGVPH